VSDDAEREPVGSVAEEAVKLLHAVQGWAEQSGGEYADATASAAAGAAKRLHDVNEHLATGGQDCTYCPVCQVIGAVRGTSPEVKRHLAAAATSLMQAVAAVMTTDVPDQSTGRARPSAAKIEMEKIEVSDDEVEDD
jgi:hypothetical protein